MRALRQNIIYALRRFAKAPVVVLAIVVSIGLGIAANATIFAMVSRFVLRPAPVGDPSTLLAMHTVSKDGYSNFQYPVFRDVQQKSKTFSGVAAYFELLSASIGGGAEPERTWGQAATANFFDVLQMPMTIGRGFSADEENAQVIVLGHALWARRFHSDPSIIGKSVPVSGRPFTVIGVAPAAFHGVDQLLNASFWVPLDNMERMTNWGPDKTANSAPTRDSRTSHYLAVVGRLRPGVTRDQARADLDTLARQLAVAYPATDKDQTFAFEQAGSLPPRDRNSILFFLAALSVVVLLVLCIAGANVANLLLAQAAGRQREMAVRLALGATRRQLLNQLLTESVLLALGGGVFGALLSLWATSALSSFHLPAPVPIDISVSVDWRVVLFTFALSVGAGLLFGLVPAWIASKPVLSRALKGEDGLAKPGRRFNLRNVLVVAQMAFSLVLLCATGLFLRSLESASTMDVGFRQRGIMMMAVDPRVHGYTPERTVQFLSQLQKRAAALPGVQSAVITDIVPLSMGGHSDGMRPEKRTDLANAELPSVDLYSVTPGYFETLGIPRIAGRDIANQAANAQKVAVVNEQFVRKIFGGENPIGQIVIGAGIRYQVIGIVKDMKSRSIGEEQRPILYRSLEQFVSEDPSFTGYTLMVRSEGDPSTLSRELRHEISSLDATLAVFNAETMQQHLRDALFLPRFAGTLFGVFGFVGIVLASVGLFGVMSYSVSRRTREIGIRIALGSQVGAVQRLIVRQGMMLIGIALLLGLPAAWAAAKFSSSILYGVHPHDAVTFTVVPMVLAGIALIACWIPSRRAARIDPQQALRYE